MAGEKPALTLRAALAKKVEAVCVHLHYSVHFYSVSTTLHIPKCLEKFALSLTHTHTSLIEGELQKSTIVFLITIKCVCV